jgi:plasmid maintenance system antidote protein VapI
MTKRLQEIHPGEILLEEFMKPMAITARRLSADMFWLNLQAEYDMRVVTRELKKKIQARIRVFQAVVA